jgi:hypothetical protein
VLDVSDFRKWLIELAEKAEQAETLEQFLSYCLKPGRHEARQASAKACPKKSRKESD